MDFNKTPQMIRPSASARHYPGFEEDPAKRRARPTRCRGGATQLESPVITGTGPLKLYRTRVV